MALSPGPKKKETKRKVVITELSSSEPSIDSPVARKYQDDEDFDEAFKNLLRPIETIAKKNHCEPLQYDLLKELDSYLNHLRGSSDGTSLIFVEAALMIQNVILIYQKRVDQFVDYMMKLIGKFRAYRRNQIEDGNAECGDMEHEEGNKKKKKEKKVKFFPSFELIKGSVTVTLKNFDCKLINLSKKPAVPKIVLNANIKVDNKYSKILPYIFIGNGENIGKKYDFMVSWPLNRDLAVNDEFDCPTNDDKRNDNPLKFRSSGDLLPMNLMDVDGVNSEDALPSSPDPVVFDQTVVEEFPPVYNLASEVNVLNVSRVPQISDEVAWASVVNDNMYSDKPVAVKHFPKKEDNGTWLPTYTVGELRCQLVKLKSGLPVDSVFRKLVHEAQEIQQSEKARKRFKPKDYDVNMEGNFLSEDEPGFRGFESPIHDDNVDDNMDVIDNIDNHDELINNAENFQQYQQNALDMQRHEQNQLEMMNEQLEMRQRVQTWHDNLRPILEGEEKRTAFDIHEYGTRVLNCFDSIGEHKSFKEVVSGLEQEEVARYFLSTLMMANTYNLKITKSVEDSDSEVVLELLKKERHHEQLQVNIGNQVNQEPN